MQPKFRLFDNKTDNGGITATSTTIPVNDNELKSVPKDVDSSDETVDTSTVNQLKTPKPNPPKSQTKPKTSKKALVVPKLELPAIVPTCNEEQKLAYEAEYQQDVEAENNYHESEVFRISGLGLLDDLLQETLNNEENRHQSVLTDLQTNLNNLLVSIACD